MRSTPLIYVASLLFAVPALAQSTSSTTSLEETNKQIVNAYLDIVENPGFDSWQLYFPDTVAFNGRSMPPQGLSGILANFRSAFPDLRFSVMGQIAEGDRVATWGFFEGTHQGEFAGIPPTNQRVRWFGAAIDRLDGGKVVELWHEMDVWGLVQRLRQPRNDTP